MALLDAGVSYGVAASQIGVTRSTLLGAVRRVNLAANAAPCACTRPENRDGGMPHRWWQAGPEANL